MSLSNEEIARIAQEAAQKTLREKVRWQLRQSMGEELVASSVYHDRAVTAKESGDEGTARLYEHIADEEDEHFTLLGWRLNYGLSGGRYVPSHKHTTEMPDKHYDEIVGSSQALNSTAKAVLDAEKENWLKGYTTKRQALLTVSGYLTSDEELLLAKKELENWGPPAQKEIDDLPEEELAEFDRKVKDATPEQLGEMWRDFERKQKALSTVQGGQTTRDYWNEHLEHNPLRTKNDTNAAAFLALMIEGAGDIIRELSKQKYADSKYIFEKWNRLSNNIRSRDWTDAISPEDQLRLDKTIDLLEGLPTPDSLSSNLKSLLYAIMRRDTVNLRYYLDKVKPMLQAELKKRAV